ncbi:hypothetical protein BCR22_11165 [Enterococcus plantarum]|uniref:Fimbrial assembly protein n=1 Tax=Enterococcus plantarum TaxID=1077675 RepID=A0A2W3Z3Z5_9ENTE|nr:hypothetical protein [Enterococcus plantarum]MBO0422890.1 hypothetical protein [Enterococcus plantarum]MBO0466980.1 hypothetical protein [Enterococcus plantarum]OEG18540.1 hypothetical protein BCR22_11165 [Enterococcus plantarum]PZL74828.1 hypothetical protein CI088_06865 [Enterococcus plantarum]
MTIFMFVLVVILFLIFSYQLYVRFQLETLDSDSPKMKRKINFYKYQENNRSLLFLMIGALVFCLVLFGILYNQDALRKDNKNLELKIDEIKDARGGASGAEIESYKENALKLTEFPWRKVVESRDAQALDNYELQLLRDWQPFFGEANVAIMISQKTETLTVSVFPTALTFSDFQTAEKNIETFIKELQPVKEITMIDFNFTYRDQTNKLSKKSIVYTRGTTDSNLEKIVLDK